MEEVPEAQLQEGEARPVHHDHEGVGVTHESLAEHLARGHQMEVPDELSFGALRGMHDRFHGEAHATDD
jgi:hypothetical protein